MFRRVFLLAAMLGAGCGSGDPHLPAGSGRLVLTRTAPSRKTLLDLPALARYCERDSTLSIVAIGGDWTGALAVRTAWPISRQTRFPVDSALGGAGSGAVAARPVGDSIQVAWVGRSGAIVVEPGPRLAGRVEAELKREAGALIRVTGRFDDLSVRLGSCL